MTISAATRRRMATNFAITFPMFAILLFPFYRRLPESWPMLLSTALLIPLLLSLFPLIVEYAMQVRARREAARSHRREAYRQSPQAHLLNLHDEWPE